MKKSKSLSGLLKENQELRIRLAEAEDTLQAIREGGVDALVVTGPRGERVYTLSGEEGVYRLLIETMSEGSVTATPEGRILFCNVRLSEILRRPMEEIVGHFVEELIQESYRKDMAELLAGAQKGLSRKRLVFVTGDGTAVPLRVSSNLLHQADGESICMVVTDLSELETSEEIVRQIQQQKKNIEEYSSALRDSRRAALNIMEDAVDARRRAETFNEQLRQEITERKEAEAALRQSEAHFRALAEALPQIVWTANPDGAVEWYNRRWYEYTGEPESAGLGWDWDKVIHPEDIAHTLDNWQAARSSESLFQNEIRIRRHDGQYRWFLVRAWPLQEVSGKVVRWFGTNTDIHDLKEAESALRESENRFRAVFESSSDCILVWDRQYNYLYANQAAIAHVGTTPDQVIGRNIRDGLGHVPDFMKLWMDRVDRAFATGQSFRVEDAVPVGDRLVYSESQISPIQDAAGQVFAVSVVYRDITERKLGEEALRQSKKDLDHAQAVGGIGSWRLDTRKNELTWSDQNHRIFGIPKGTPLTYETFLSAVHPDDRSHVDAQWKAGLAGGKYDIEHRIVVDGQVKWVREKAYLEFDDKGGLIGGFGITQDITRIRLMQEQLRQANEELEKRVKRRTQELQQTVEALESEVLQRITAEASIQAERQRFRDVLETLPSYVCLLTPEYRMPFANRMFREWFGYETERKCYEFLFQRTEPCEICETYKALKTNSPHRWEWTGPNGRIYDVFDFPFQDADGSRLILEMGMDITEQRKAEQAVREHQTALRALAAQLHLAEEQERRRLAQDLHDSIGQILSFSGRELKALQKYLPDKTAKVIREVTRQLDLAVEQARTLSFDLSPSILYDLGFPVAVEDLVERFSREHNLSCRFENCPTDLSMEDDVKILLYRSVRELLLNAAKHARAGRIQVSLQHSGSQIHIVVEDNGLGFDPAAVQDTPKRVGGFGLFSIRERLDHIGGRMEIESAPGAGTKVILKAPLNLEPNSQKESPHEH